MAKQEIREFGDFTGENNQGYIIVGGKTADIEGGKKLLSDIVPVVPEQVQADWAQDDDTQKDYIKNKPTVEDGAQVNKIEGIVIQGDVLPIVNKLVTLDFGSGALIDDNGYLDFHCTAPLCNGKASDGGASLAYDDTLTLNNNALSVANPMPECSTTTEGILVHHSGGQDMNDYYEWIYADKTIKIDGSFEVANPVPVPNSNHSDIGKVLTVQQASDPEDPDEIVWAAPQSSEIQLPSMPTKNGTGGELNETTTRIRLVGECNHEDHFTLKWEYE